MEVSAWVPPQELEEYRLLRRLGSGSMGQVFLAHDTFLDRSVAIKFLVAGAPNRLALERFVVEARAAARVQHPNVVAVYRAGDVDGHPYLVSEFIDGESLDRVRLPLPMAQAKEIALGLAKGLAAAHRHGVLHRDIKPGNAIMATDGTVKLVDFGVAKLTDPFAAELARLTSRPPAAPIPISRARASAELPIDRSPLMVRSSPALSAVLLAPYQSDADRVHRSAATLPLADSPSLPLRLTPQPGKSPVNSSALTGVGMLLGTPLYLAPEAWLGEPATPASDVYSLGAMIYELCAGVPPHQSTDLTELATIATERDAKPLSELVPDIDAEFSDVIQRCLARDPNERYRNGPEACDAFERLLVGTTVSVRLPDGNPYLGLRPFEAEHRGFFFGRGTELRAVLERLRHDPLVLVAGDSGVGKSSLCRAGVLPMVADGVLQQGRSWQVTTVAPGSKPLATLVGVLSSWLPALNEDDLRRRLWEGTLGTLAAELRKLFDESRGAVLFIDQLEELVTIADPLESKVVSEVLVRLATAVPGLRILGTVRGDLLTRLASLPGLGEAMTNALYLLRPLSQEGVREAVVGPARVRGGRFESEALVETLVDSACRAEGSLPLLQFALAELWEARDQATGVITEAALKAIGGVEGALARHADDVLLAMPTAHRVAARSILVRLATPDGTRIYRSDEELVAGDPERRAALEALVRGRLIIVRESLAAGSTGTGGAATCQIAHEALLRDWATLRSWLELDAGRRLVQDRLARAAEEWVRLGRGEAALWTRQQLGEIAGLDQQVLEPLELEFVTAAQRAIQKKRWRLRALLFGIPLALALTAGGIRWHTVRETARQVENHLATAHKELASAHRAEAEANVASTAAFAAFDRMEIERGEELWAAARKSTENTRLFYERAVAALDRAHALAPGRPDIFAHIGEVYYALALISEREFQLTPSELQRFQLYDDGGELRARWGAPAEVGIQAQPVTAAVRISSYIADEHGRMSLEGERVLGPVPRQEKLQPGSYLLTFEAPGHVTVRYPLLLRRAEQLDLRLELPRAEDVPSGFAFVPAGRFYFGAREEEVRRSFFRTAPIHLTTTEAYLIARHETTFSEWITYLEALPDAERAKRTPFTESFAGGLVLEKIQGSWQIGMRPAERTYTARAGQPIVYTRSHGAEQNWLRMPVTGISWEDAQAYTAWLSATGRVPGARLCTEREFERAARGADIRRYPHGDELLPGDANYDETYGKVASAMGLDEVGAHPASRSPFGVDDLAGNAFEWVLSSLSNAADEAAVIRSGSYFQGSVELNAANREAVVPTVRDLRGGLRVCASRSP